MSRPRTLWEVSKRVQSGGVAFSMAVREFLDSFYGGDASARQAALKGRPVKLSPVEDAYLAAVAEHLALEYGLGVPTWTETQGNDLRKPHFAGGLDSLKAVLIAESPLAFRKRLLFVSANALSRPIKELNRQAMP